MSQLQKYFSTLFLVLTTVFSSFAQSKRAQLVTSTFTHDFGFVKESDSVLVHDFLLQKKGREVTRILAIKAECGCLSTFFPKDTLAPSDTFRLRVAMHLDRPVQKEFHKSITVIASNDTVNLHLKGHIIPEDIGDNKQMFTFKRGALSLRNSNFQFGLLSAVDAVSKRFDLYNVDTLPLKVRFDSLPEYVSLNSNEFTIPGNQAKSFYMTYDASRVAQVGYIVDTIYLKINEDSLYVKSLYVSSNIRSIFSKDSIQPKARVDVNRENLGAISKKSYKDVFFEVFNDGEAPLKVLKLVSPCSCIKLQDLKNRLIAPGESLKVGASIVNDGRKGNATKVFYVYTNDPTNSILEFKLKVTFIQ